MAGQKIRIKLMSYDNEMLDTAAARIVDTMKKSGAKISGPIPLPTEVVALNAIVAFSNITAVVELLILLTVASSK